MNDAKAIGSIPFIDGSNREAFFDADDQQFVLDENGQPVYDIWIYIDELQFVTRLS